jgi:hypothetical protein
MVVAESDQQAQFKSALACRAAGPFVLHYRRVLAVHLEDALLQGDAAGLAHRHRKRIEPELAQILVPARMRRARIEVHR